MEYFYNTKHVNKSWVQKGAWHYIKAMLEDQSMYYYWKNGLDQLQIIVSPLSMAKDDPFVQHFIRQGLKINLGVPFGITGENQIKIFINDDENLWKFVPDRLTSQLLQVYIHELSHYLLRIKDPDTKVKLRHDDTSGHKAGTLLDWATAEVHDLDHEGYDWKDKVHYRVSFWDRRVLPILLSGIDVRSALKTGPQITN